MFAEYIEVAEEIECTRYSLVDGDVVDLAFEEVFGRNDKLELLLTDLKFMDLEFVRRFRRSHLSLQEKKFKLSYLDLKNFKGIF